jgi:hypothetical protein
MQLFSAISPIFFNESGAAVTVGLTIYNPSQTRM